eukprot:scaffold10210_cov199-Chaetoceros_neogracile.AAC.2
MPNVKANKDNDHRVTHPLHHPRSLLHCSKCFTMLLKVLVQSLTPYSMQCLSTVEYLPRGNMSQIVIALRIPAVCCNMTKSR